MKAMSPISVSNSSTDNVENQNDRTEISKAEKILRNEN